MAAGARSVVLIHGQLYATAAAGRHDSPHGLFDYAVVVLAMLAVIFVTVQSIRYFMRPGEKDPRHIKRQVLADEPGGGLSQGLELAEEAVWRSETGL